MTRSPVLPGPTAENDTLAEMELEVPANAVDDAYRGPEYGIGVPYTTVNAAAEVRWPTSCVKIPGHIV